ncbi:hypothetical protein COU76_05020 [Candidatus Peregrinibacteria bacterium CG10_big_fil_rev_8_21_14_0_10_49_10]|nr:MAG: hypothetical protein COU76_05020 [Candidatus Peregrinibacteria bacterium CG10_big_fil_rev_8_21_14_0_10_49_10]
MEVGVTPGRFSLIDRKNLEFDPASADVVPLLTADLQTLLIADHPEMNLEQTFTVSTESGPLALHGVQQLIEQFAPILNFSEGEDFPMPFPVEGYNVPLTGDMNAEISVRNPLPNATPTIYASVLEKNGELAINYYFFYPMSNWGEHKGYNTHEGDWEGATVFLKKNADGSFAPDRVALAQHKKNLIFKAFDEFDGGESVPWNAVAPVGRLDLYVGEGSHSTFGSSDESTILFFPELHEGAEVETMFEGSVIYLPRLGAASPASDATLWRAFPGFWGSKDLDGIQIPFDLEGDNAPQGPVVTSSGFPAGTRWLNPWDWESTFKS